MVYVGMHKSTNVQCAIYTVIATLFICKSFLQIPAHCTAHSEYVTSPLDCNIFLFLNLLWICLPFAWLQCSLQALIDNLKAWHFLGAESIFGAENFCLTNPRNVWASLTHLHQTNWCLQHCIFSSGCYGLKDIYVTVTSYCNITS